MRLTKQVAPKRQLLLGFDAFGTLFYPKEPIPKQYARFAEAHGIECVKPDINIKDTFKTAYKYESSHNPNYGKATGLGAEKWWANVITNTFRPFLKQGQQVPKGLIRDLITQFSTRAGYALYPDVLPFFHMLRAKKQQSSNVPGWKWDRTVVGIITNSDSRVPDILASFGLSVGPRRVGSTARRESEASLDDDANFVVLSYDVGYEKPDPRTFDAAVKMGQETIAENGSIEEFERLYVGDSIKKDYFGARNAGWNALLLDRSPQDDNMKDSPIAESRIVSTDEPGRLVERKVHVVRDLGALTEWSPGETEPLK